ncbi:MAG: hypothetical protein ACRD9L_22515 [Bryobacteraceae bacterium]
MFSKASKFLHYVVPGVARPLRVLWNEIIGFVFLCLAVPALTSAVRTLHKFDGGDGSSVLKLVVTSIFGLIMICFGVSSFMRARKISRS